MPYRCEVCLEEIIVTAFDYVLVHHGTVEGPDEIKWYHPCCAVQVLDNKVAEDCCEKHWLATK